MVTSTTLSPSAHADGSTVQNDRFTNKTGGDIFSFVSGSCFIRAVMVRLGLLFVLVGLVTMAKAAETEEGFFAPKLNLLTTQFNQTGTDFLPPYLLSASVEIAPPLNSAPIGLGLGRSFQLPSDSKPQQVPGRAMNMHWQRTYDDIRDSVLDHVRFELKGERTNISFQPGLVSIEVDQLDISLQSHSVSMLWSSEF